MQRRYVNAGGLFFFSGEVSAAFEKDVLASNLYFQLAASARYDKFDDGAGWRQVYLGAISAFGHGILRRDVQSIPLTERDSVWELAKHKLRNRVSIALIEQVEQTFRHLQDRNIDAFELIKEHTARCLPVNTDKCRLPISGSEEARSETTIPAASSVAACEPLSTVSLLLAFVDAEPLITQVMLSFKTTASVASLPFSGLFAPEKVKGNLELTIVTVELDDHHYARVRDKVLEMLGARRQSLMVELAEVRT